MDKPICINFGCDKPCVYTGKRHRSVCASCYKDGFNPRPGVTLFKKNRCDNEGGKILGIPCPVQDWDSLRSLRVPLTDLDHIDGIHTNNFPANIQELCPLCHRIKGKLNNDHQNGRYPRSETLFAFNPFTPPPTPNP